MTSSAIGSGWLSDRFDVRKLLFVYYDLRGLSSAALLFSNFDFYQLPIFAIFSGLDWAATMPPTVKFTADRFGARSNLVFGWIFAAHQLGAGLLRTGLETYLPAFFFRSVLCLWAAIAVVIVREGRQDASAE